MSGSESSRGGVAGLILAAGGSTRMGRAKQLLQYEGQSLLRRIAATAIKAKLSPLVVVLGSGAAATANEVANLPVEIVINSNWETGIGSSIRAGVSALRSHNSVDAIVVMLADQPFVNAATIRALIDKQRATRAPIVASRYSETLGVPAIFAREYFARLAELPDVCGAKQLIANAGTAVAYVDFAEGACDIDTPEQYAALQNPPPPASS